MQRVSPNTPSVCLSLSSCSTNVSTIIPRTRSTPRSRRSTTGSDHALVRSVPPPPHLSCLVCRVQKASVPESQQRVSLSTPQMWLHHTSQDVFTVWRLFFLLLLFGVSHLSISVWNKLFLFINKTASSLAAFKRGYVSFVCVFR